MDDLDFEQHLLQEFVKRIEKNALKDNIKINIDYIKEIEKQTEKEIPSIRWSYYRGL